MVYRHKTNFMHKNADLYKILKIRRINRQMLEHWVRKRKEIRKNRHIGKHGWTTNTRNC